MFVTEDEAAAMYARAFRRWHKSKAKSKAKSTIQALEKRGDHKGVRMWQKVLRTLEAAEKPCRKRRRIERIAALTTRVRSAAPIARQDHAG